MRLKNPFVLLLSIFLTFPVASCSLKGAETLEGANLDQQQVLEAQAQHLRHVQVTIVAPVLKILPDDTQGIPHERFLIALSNGTSVLIAHDTRLAPRVPVQPGDQLKICGEYIWNEKGGVIHWTHHAIGGIHPGGFIELYGQRYE